MATITSGDTGPFLVTLKFNGGIYALSSGSDTVKAAFLDAKSGSLITSVVTMGSGNAGADWTNGVVSCIFDATNMALLANYDGQTIALEIEVTKPTGKQTFRGNYVCRKGYIP